jgi:hypothetical protein
MQILQQLKPAYLRLSAIGFVGNVLIGSGNGE